MTMRKVGRKMNNNLKCDAVHCAYNTDRFCSANEIEVQGDDTMGGRFTYCGTFEERNEESGMKEMSNINLGELSNAAMDPVVACTAVNCTYNHNQYCQANRVNIVSAVASTAEQTECETFYPR